MAAAAWVVRRGCGVCRCAAAAVLLCGRAGGAARRWRVRVCVLLCGRGGAQTEAHLDRIRDPLEGDIAGDERGEDEHRDAQQREPGRVERVVASHEQHEQREDGAAAELEGGDEEWKVAEIMHELLLDDGVHASGADEDHRCEHNERRVHLPAQCSGTLLEVLLGARRGGSCGRWRHGDGRRDLLCDQARRTARCGRRHRLLWRMRARRSWSRGLPISKGPTLCRVEEASSTADLTRSPGEIARARGGGRVVYPLDGRDRLAGHVCRLRVRRRFRLRLASLYL